MLTDETLRPKVHLASVYQGNITPSSLVVSFSCLITTSLKKDCRDWTIHRMYYKISKCFVSYPLWNFLMTVPRFFLWLLLMVTSTLLPFCNWTEHFYVLFCFLNPQSTFSRDILSTNLIGYDPKHHYSWYIFIGGRFQHCKLLEFLIKCLFAITFSLLSKRF